MNKEDTQFINDLAERNNNHIIAGGDWRAFSAAKEIQGYFDKKRMK